jgi:hypothetical protein
VPKLDPARLQTAVGRLRSANLSGSAKRSIAGMLVNASKDGDSIAAAIASLPPERQEHIGVIQAELVTFTTDVLTRSADELLAMDEAEWAALVDEANSS